MEFFKLFLQGVRVSVFEAPHQGHQLHVIRVDLCWCLLSRGDTACILTTDLIETLHMYSLKDFMTV